MRKGNFEVEILENIGFGTKEYCVDPRVDAVVQLVHKSTYAIKLASWSGRANATIVIDGKEVGTFRLLSRNPIIIERPVNIDKKFTFYELGTHEAENAGLHSNNEFLGIVQVIFIPGKPREVYQPRSFEKGLTFGGGEATRGGTGLSGKSNQVFGQANEIELDYSKETTITFKLKPKEDDIQPIIEAYSQKINLRSRKLTRQQFRELFEKEFGVNSEQAKSQIINCVSKGVIDPNELSEYDINKIRNYYNEGW
jgi:hypothetical protein